MGSTYARCAHTLIAAVTLTGPRTIATDTNKKVLTLQICGWERKSYDSLKIVFRILNLESTDAGGL